MVAAVDLGSNSFRLTVARTDGGGAGFRVFDDLKEKVALAKGMSEHGRLTVEAQDRAIACLERFGERLRGLAPDAVRAMGTSTLRVAENAEELLARAEEALGHRVEVISGDAEAELVFRGVAHGSWAEGRRLVLDIGGGSTELIIGQGLTPEVHRSVPVGHVVCSETACPRGELSAKRLRKAIEAASEALEPACAVMREHGWDGVVGTSGTLRTTERVLEKNGYTTRGITRDGLEQLRGALVSAGHVEDVDLDGLSKSRRETIAGGLAVLIALFDRLAIDHLVASPAGLREGLLHTLLEHSDEGDLRERTVARLVARYGIDRAQARRVRRTAWALLDQVGDDWQLEDAWSRRMLGWAATLHEIGHAIRYKKNHKRGRKILERSVLPGFGVQDQLALAMLVLCHRRKLRREKLERAMIHPARRREATRLAVLLRLAVRLHRTRGATPLPDVRLEVDGEELRLRVPVMVAKERPLLWADLSREAERLADAGFELHVKTDSDLGLIEREAA